MAALENTEPRTYGNWRRPGGGGLFGMSKIATYGGLAHIAFSVLLMIVAGPIIGFVALFVGLGLIGLASFPLLNGRTALQSVVPRVAHTWDVATGQTVHRAGPHTTNGTFRLPGLAADSKLSEATDAQGRPFAIVTLPRRSHHTIVFSASPDGDSLVDDDQINVWVARWGAWLATLGDEPGLIAVSVTVETAPDSGERLRRELNATTIDDAAAIAASMVTEIAETYPNGSATTNAMIAMTFRGVRGQYRQDVERDLAGRVAHFATELLGTGAGAVRPMSAQELCEKIRVAYDPDAQKAFDDARALNEKSKLSWQEVGPAAAEAKYDHYLHENKVSVTWVMIEPPNGNVTSEVLSRLLKPHPDVTRKRVTMLYRPLDSARASRVVEADKRDAETTVRNNPNPTERMKIERDMAQKAAEEQVQGAGVTNFGMVITATTDCVENLPQVHRVIGQLTPTARLRVRPAYGGQEAAFTACLPLGVVLPAHQKTAVLREAM